MYEFLIVFWASDYIFGIEGNCFKNNAYICIAITEEKCRKVRKVSAFFSDRTNRQFINRFEREWIRRSSRYCCTMILLWGKQKAIERGNLFYPLSFRSGALASLFYL